MKCGKMHDNNGNKMHGVGVKKNCEIYATIYLYGNTLTSKKYMID